MPGRFCPFCGQDNAAEYAFCQRCGKPLPPPLSPAPAAPAPVPPGASPPPPQPPAAAQLQTAEEIDEASATAFERPITDEERKSLRQSARRPAVGLTRVFATLTGLVPIMFLLTSMMGAPYVPFNYIVIVTASAFLALGLGAASAALRFPAAVALASGRAVEMRGVPEKQASGVAGLTPVALGGARLEVPPEVADKLRASRANALAFVPSGMGRGARKGKARALVLAVNGAPLPRPAPAYLALGSEAELKEYAALFAVGAKRARR